MLTRQASRHLQLQPGLVLTNVGPSPVLGKPYAATLEILKSCGRPVTLSFKAGGTVHKAASSPRKAQAAAADPYAGVTGKAAAQALHW